MSSLVNCIVAKTSVSLLRFEPPDSNPHGLALLRPEPRVDLSVRMPYVKYEDKSTVRIATKIQVNESRYKRKIGFRGVDTSTRIKAKALLALN
jgi:hypothetical protein